MSGMRNSEIGRLIGALSPCVLDIGARGGLDEDLLAIAWASHIIGFEPDVKEAERLAEADDARWKQVTVLPLAVGGSSGPAVLHVPASNAGASLLRHDPAMVDLFGYDNLHIVRDEIPVNTVTLDSLRAEGRLPRIDFMKIDIEGAELDVLKAALTVLPDCVAIKVECSFLPQRIEQPLVWDVAPFLLGQKFAIVEIHDIHRWRRRNLPAHPYRIGFEMPYSRGQVAQCDLVLLKTPDGVDTQAQALRLVVVSAVLGYFDYAITVIRAKPELTRTVKEEYGFDLESELKSWAARSGRSQVGKAIRSTCRSMVPLLRSFLGRLPYAAPTRPY